MTADMNVLIFLAHSTRNAIIITPTIANFAVLDALARTNSYNTRRPAFIIFLHNFSSRKRSAAMTGITTGRYIDR